MGDIEFSEIRTTTGLRRFFELIGEHSWADNGIVSTSCFLKSGERKDYIDNWGVERDGGSIVCIWLQESKMECDVYFYFNDGHIEQFHFD